MNKILFVNGNLRGHFNPTLPVVRELVSRGEEVWYFAFDIFKDELEAAGAHFISAGSEMDEFISTFKAFGVHPFYTLLEYKVKYDSAMIPVLLERIKDLVFDVLVYDSYLGGGSVLQSVLNIPSVCSTTTFALKKLPLTQEQLLRGSNAQLDHVYHILDELCSKWGVNTPDVTEFFASAGNTTIVYTPKEFNPGGTAFGDSYIFTGPSIAIRQKEDDFPWQALNGNTLIYISMGTINTDLSDFYKICMRAFHGSGYQSVMSVGNKIDFASLGEIPDDFIICRQVPQLELLKKSALFISHGGLNSINEAIYFGVPTIVLPLMNDQFITAMQVAKLGLGITLKFSEITVESLWETANTVINEPSYKENCNHFSTLSLIAGGYQLATDVIQRMGGNNHGNKE